MCFSQTALRKNINNSANPKVIDNLKLLTQNILQKLRDQLGAIRVTSAYRSRALNRAIGGARNSAHITGNAADIVIIRDGKMDNKLIFDAVLELNLEFDQMIWEFGGKWIHIAYKLDNNRKQVLEAYKDDDNKTKYREYPNYKSL
jgi:zinc D-Ala-D-Ala carboxypeptidase